MSIEKLICGFLVAFFQTFTVYYIIMNQLEKKDKKNKKLFFLLVFIFCIVSYFLIPNNLRLVTFIFYILLIIYFVINIKDKKAILYIFNLETISVVSEIIITCMFVLFGTDPNKIVNNNLYNMVIVFLISLTSILIFNLKFINKLINKINKKLYENINIINYVFIILTALYLIVLKNGSELISKSNFYINLLIIFLFIFILFKIVKNELKYEQLDKENKQMLNYVTKYEKIITKQGKANHEFKNQLMVIKGYAQMESDKLLEYINSIVEDSKKSYNSHLISELNKIPEGGIKGLIYYKLSIMDEYNINYELNVNQGLKAKFKSLSINTIKNITKILGVILDNAIDACKDHNSKNICIEIEKNSKIVKFIISNTYNKKIQINKIGTGYTTKGKGHGYGLRLVNDIINNSDNLKFETNINDKYYTTILSIKF